MVEQPTPSGSSTLAGVTPAPTDEEAVAIVAALDAAWPRAGMSADSVEPDRWRWSGRWWTKPHTLRRDRPW